MGHSSTPSLGALVLSSTSPEEVVRFYRALGMPLEEEDHGDGHVHWACPIGDVQTPTMMPWGRRAIVRDPDGRPVEIYEPAPVD